MRTWIGKNRQFLMILLPGLVWLTIQAVRIVPPPMLLAGGHPNYGYYAYSFSHWQYSDVVALYGARRLFLHTWPYFQNIIEYPVLIGLYMSGMALLPGFIGYLVGSAIGLAAAFTVSLYVLWRLRGPVPALWFSVSPLLLVFGLLNWDLLGIATWGLAIWAFERKRYRLSGLFVGIGVATKFFPIVLLPYLGMYLYRRERRRHRIQLKQFLTGFLWTGVGINLPFALFAERGWSQFFTYNSGRGPDPGVYQWLMQIGLLQIDWINLISAVLTVAGGLYLLSRVYRKRLSPVAAAASALAWWFLCNKVYSPQYILWAFYAILWLELNPVQLLLINMAGLFDFGLAMRWLALGTTGSPFLQQFVNVAVPPVLILRYATLIWTAIRPLLEVRKRFSLTKTESA